MLSQNMWAELFRIGGFDQPCGRNYTGSIPRHFEALQTGVSPALCVLITHWWRYRQIPGYTLPLTLIYEEQGLTTYETCAR